MFQRLTDLLFGRLDSGTHESAVPKSGGLEGEEEEWLLVGIPDGEPVELNPVPSSASVSRSVQAADSTKATDSFISNNSMEDPGLPAAQDSGPVSRSSAPKAKSVRMGRLQWPRVRADRFHLGPHCIQRQNRVQQRLPRHTSRTRPVILHQPGHRNSCH